MPAIFSALPMHFTMRDYWAYSQVCWGFYFFVLASRPNYRSQICFTVLITANKPELFCIAYTLPPRLAGLCAYRVILTVKPFQHC
ncbi:hypothetical protein [Vibrio cholerae]